MVLMLWFEAFIRLLEDQERQTEMKISNLNDHVARAAARRESLPEIDVIVAS